MPEQPEQKQETVGEVVAAMRRYAELVAAANADISPELAQLLREYAGRVERASKREMDEAAEFIDDYLNEIPVYHPPHDWLIRNGYKDTSYQNDIFEDQNDGAAPAPDGAERDAKGETTK